MGPRFVTVAYYRLQTYPQIERISSVSSAYDLQNGKGSHVPSENQGSWGGSQ